jgi:hypothetical protein
MLEYTINGVLYTTPWWLATIGAIVVVTIVLSIINALLRS